MEEENKNLPTNRQILDSQKNYSEEGLWDKVKHVAKSAGIKVIYLALLLYYTASSDTTPLKHKAIIYGALGYFILPLDLIPDALPLGYSDDLAAFIACVKAVSANITPEITDQAKLKLHDWFGEYNEKEIDHLV